MQRHPVQARPIAGFTLLELMIAVAIVAIVMTIAYPSYQRYLIESRRADAQNALLGFGTAMERYRSDNSSYAGAQSGTGFPNPPESTVYPSQTPIDSSDKFYNLTIEAADSNGYTVRATPISGTVQDGDGYLELTSTGFKRWDQDDDGFIGSGESDWND